MSAVSPVRAPITPSVLTWAIDAGGYEREDVAKSAGVSVDKLSSWEQGNEKPTLNQLRSLAEKVRRPYPVFFLQAPPSGTESLPDLRTRGSLTGDYSPQLRLEIRRAKYYQTLVADHQPPLLEPASIPQGSPNESPAEAAARVRAWLGVDLETQRGFRGEDRGFAQWRNVLLEHGVLSYVFRLEALEQGEASEALGFCLPKTLAPLVAVNGEGAPAEKVFGLFHELGHLVRGEAGVSASPLPILAFPNETEQWCNRFANRCLLPDDPSLRSIVESLPTGTQAIEAYQRAATKLRVSRYVLLHRAREEGWIPTSVFDSLRTIFVSVDEEQREIDRRKKIEKRERDKAASKAGGGQSPVEISLSRRGAAAAARIAQRWSEGRISDGEAAELLDIDPAQLESLLHKAIQRSGAE